MAQLARPDGDITNTGNGGFADIDETTPSDSDFWWGDNNQADELEVSLSNVTDPVSSSGHTFRYRIAKTNAGVVDGGGNAVTVTARLMQGTTQIATDVAQTATGTWTQYAYTLTSGEADAITNYTDLRLEFLTSAWGGSPAARRGGAVSWAELEIPDLSGTEYTDSATVPVLFTPSGTEEHTTFDADTVYIGLLASSAELAEYTDADTVYLLLTPSGVDVFPKRTDYARLSLASGDFPEVQIDHKIWIRARKTNGAHTGTIRARLYEGANPIGPELETSNLSTSLASYQLAIADGDAAIITDYSNLELRIRGWASEGDSTVFEVADVWLQIPPAETGITTDAATIYLDLEASGVELAEYVDASEIYLDLQPITTDEERQQYDADTVYLDLEAISTFEERQQYDAETVPLNLQPASVEVTEFVDEALTYLILTPSSVDLADLVDSETVPLGLLPSGADIADYIEAQEMYLDLEASGTEFMGGTNEDQATIDLLLQITSVDIAEFADASTAYLDLEALSADIAELSDAFVVPLVFTPTSVDVAEYVDVATVVLIFTPGAIAGGEDAQLVYLKLTPGTFFILGVFSAMLFDRHWKGAMYRRWLR